MNTVQDCCNHKTEASHPTEGVQLGVPVYAAGRVADVKRCYSMRATLALLDFEDPSIQGVQTLMVRAAMLPAFLRCADGRKLIAHLFTLHVTPLLAVALH